MKKVFALEDLDCANCAAKMEEGIKKLDGVKNANVSYITQKMTIVDAIIISQLFIAVLTA